MSNSVVVLNIEKLLKKAGDKVDLVARRIAVDLGRKIVVASPVKTGRFKSNWFYGAGEINTSTNAPAGSDAMVAIEKGIAGWEPGQLMYITNSLSYARRLEYDSWSKQAPAGMVRLAVQNFNISVANAVKES